MVDLPPTNVGRVGIDSRVELGLALDRGDGPGAAPGELWGTDDKPDLVRRCWSRMSLRRWASSCHWLACRWNHSIITKQIQPARIISSSISWNVIVFFLLGHGAHGGYEDRLIGFDQDA